MGPAMNYDDVIAHWGTQAAAAEAIGVSQATICRWHTQLNGRIPVLQQLWIETLTQGALRADDPLFGRKPKGKPSPAEIT